MNNKILWIIQPNQTTPTILDFLELFQNRIRDHAQLVFMVPESSDEVKKAAKKLNPSTFKVDTRTARKSYNAYLAKKDLLKNGRFSDGLAASDVLLLDDFSGGDVQQTEVHFNDTENIKGIILQVPTPLGSSAMEEKIFQAVIFWAGQNRIPVIGYELLPLDTNWMLAPSLPDGMITRERGSFLRLKDHLPHNNVWQLPWYEASILSPLSDSFNIKGVKASYHHMNNLSIPFDRTVLYIPHNVAMTYEYHTLLKILQPLGKKLHLMFSSGADQARGGHSHKSIIETTYKSTLDHFASYSFHQGNYTWEILMADCVVACAKCVYTLIAAEKRLPWVIFDPKSPMKDDSETEITENEEELLHFIEKIISRHAGQRDLGNILLQLIKSERMS